MKKLSKKERLFCRLYAQLRNPKEAARRAGYDALPELAGLKLLADGRIRREIRSADALLGASRAEAVNGFRKLAFGDISDAVRLMQALDAGETVEPGKLDLFMISELKRPKGGGLELKFFDRQKALERLEGLAQEDSDALALPFYKALESSARSVYKDGGEGE